MPGYILHLTAAKMLLGMIDRFSPIYRDEKEQNKFYAGCLLPDTVKEKSASHFRNPKYSDEMIEYPDLDMFRKKYGHLLKESSCFGYYFHLYVDYRFYKDYLPSLIEFRDRENNTVTKKDKVQFVYLKKKDKLMLLEDFYNHEFYYGDYTKMNTYLVEKFRLPVSLDTGIENPGIEEVDYSDLAKVLEELKGYLNVPSEEIEKLNVFDVNDVLLFLTMITFEFLESADC